MGQCGEIPSRITFPGRLRGKIPGRGMICAAFSAICFPVSIAGQIIENLGAAALAIAVF
ncbi:hypothetical protein NB636_05085 [Oxalobacter aliiformigenes]|uniref:hypothetical protein n=1 Tax=Oxalobacter aliiformigenes TaxID=2946593 RepID=UPI0022AEB0E7|nr:hypothetical protein [Oxalobacter aliiformigenes]WAW00223.1 hypothetical protein NB636_05085 [Oxalobacter aliiformigenes]